jgi:hypothetical protein
MSTFTKFVRLIKVDAAQREVYGVVTSEVPDKDGEICDYPSTKPHYAEWSGEFARATAGKSLGNVREMHSHSAVGKVVDLVFDDPNKTIAVRARIVDDTAWTKCEEGVYTGFSHGGEYVGEPWPDGDFLRYTAKPSEISLVDNPCNPEAHFEYVKADGSVELRKFQMTEIKDRKMKKLMVDAADLANLLTQVNALRGCLAAEAETEDDDSPVPAQLKEWIDDGVAILSALVAEEGAELTADKVAKAVNPPLAAQVEAAPPALAATPETLEKRAENDLVARAVVEQRRQITDLAGAVQNLTEAMTKTLADPLPRKTAGPAKAITKEQDNESANHNPDPGTAADPQALLKQCLSQPIALERS